MVTYLAEQDVSPVSLFTLERVGVSSLSSFYGTSGCDTALIPILQT